VTVDSHCEPTIKTGVVAMTAAVLELAGKPQ
jgi:hypothetical protein